MRTHPRLQQPGKSTLRENMPVAALLVALVALSVVALRSGPRTAHGLRTSESTSLAKMDLSKFASNFPSIAPVESQTSFCAVSAEGRLFLIDSAGNAKRIRHPFDSPLPDGDFPAPNLSSREAGEKNTNPQTRGPER